jgi:hypothetical protein
MIPPQPGATVAALIVSAAIALAGCAANPADRLTMPRAAPGAMRAQAAEFCGPQQSAVLSGWIQRSRHGGKRVYVLFTIWTCGPSAPD